MANAILTPEELAGTSSDRPSGPTQRALSVAAAPLVDAVFEDEAPSAPAADEPVARTTPTEPRRAREVSLPPRALTTAIRKELGIPAAKIPPYRFGFAALIVGLVAPLMLMLGWTRATVGFVVIAFGLVPAVRWWERREIELRERVFTHGREVVGRIVDVEPGGPDRNGKVVRLEFIAGKSRVATSVFGCPLARRGLEPGDDVVLYFDEREPTRCLIVERIAREKPRAKTTRPKTGGGGGCGKGSCGGGGCGSGGCGSGGCGSGGCC